MEAQSTVQIPRVAIRFCTQCKWNLRAAYYAQELLQTFSTSIGEISLIPVTGGIFTVTLYHQQRDLPPAVDPSSTPSSTIGHRPATPATSSIGETSSSNTMIESLQLTSTTSPSSETTRTGLDIQETLIWDRKRDAGFPETKELKNRIRNIIDPQRDMGHIDRSLKKSKGENGKENQQGTDQDPSQGRDQAMGNKQVVESSTRQTEDKQRQVEAETKSRTASGENVDSEGSVPHQQQQQQAKPQRIEPSTGKPLVECEDCQ